MFFPIPNNATLSIVDLYNADETLFDRIKLPQDFDNTENREYLINSILMRSKDFECLYPDPVFMKRQIEYWSAENIFVWDKIFTLSRLQYNPIENYDRMEESTEAGANSTERTGELARTRTGESDAERTGETTTARSGNSKQTGADSRTETAAEKAEETGQTSKAGYNTEGLAVQSGNYGTNESTRTANVGTSSDTEATTTETGAGTTSDTEKEKTRDTETQNSSDKENSNHNILRNSRIHGNIGVTTVAQMMKGELEIYPELNLIKRITEDFVTEFCIMVY